MTEMASIRPKGVSASPSVISAPADQLRRSLATMSRKAAAASGRNACGCCRHHEITHAPISRVVILTPAFVGSG
jgi:hypothetical protein